MHLSAFMKKGLSNQAFYGDVRKYTISGGLAILAILVMALDP
jgi:hypothetical protein